MTLQDPIEVSLADDGYVPPPDIMAEKLHDLTRAQKFGADYYGNGGAVEELEIALAKHLGKECAVMFPTGTLANLMAMQCLAGKGPSRIIVHRDSHLFNDSGDNLSNLGGYTMVPLAGTDASFPVSDLQRELERTANARVESRIGSIAIESPSRRHYGGRFDDETLEQIIALAREHKVPLFLDGARMLIECAYTGRSPNAMAEPFQIVYISLYKYLGAPFGCVLAGPKDLLNGIYHQRRRYGGSLYQAWPAAVLALDRLPGFSELWKKVIPASEAVLSILDAGGAVQVERVLNGTNIALLSVVDAVLDGERLKSAGKDRKLKLPTPEANKVPVKINETWLTIPPEDLADRVSGAMRDATRA